MSSSGVRKQKPLSELETLLNISQLNVGYRKVIISNFNRSLERGKLYALTGRNGTGKTTLLKTIAGLIKPLSGNIMINGSDLTTMLPVDRARAISIVMTHRIQLQGLDVRSLVLMGRYPMQGRFTFSTAADEALVNNSLVLLGITHLAEKSLAELSDGEMQKAMIARTLVQKTPLVIMDEPTAFLDYIAREELFVVLKELVRTENITILFSSHDIELVKKYADEIISI